MFKTLTSTVNLGRLLGLALLAGLLVLRAIDPTIVERTRLQTFDLYQRLVPRETGNFPVVILDIDDRSLAELGQWPWPRTLLATLTERAMQAGAVALAFDIVFSEPDRLSPAVVAADNPQLPEDLRAVMLEQPSNDRILADAFARSRVVVGQTSVRIGTQRTNQIKDIRQIPHAFIGHDPTPFLLKFPNLIENLSVLEDAALGHGVFTVLPDSDGVYRRVPIVMMVEGALRLSLSVELLRVATGGNAFATRANEAGIEGVVVAGQMIRTQGDGTVWTRLSKSDPDRFVSAVDLIRGDLPPQRLQGRLVLVGTSAIGLEDFRATALGVPMAGVELHVQLLENILGNELLKRSNTADVQELFWVACLSLLVIALAPMMQASWLIVSSLLLVSAYASYSYLSFAWTSTLVDPTYPMFSTILSLMLTSSTNYLREERRKRRIRNAFGQYVSPDLVAKLADSPEGLTLGGERRDLSVLFSDIRGFTTLAETFREDPQGLTRLMNRMLTAMSEPILQYGGTIDKFMGDAVMAFWNAPLDHPDHASDACHAALKMVAAVHELNQQRKKDRSSGEEVRPIDIGIAVNTGTCFVGNMGSDTRFDYTAVGDTVNVASRLEGQTKSYGVRILVGEATAKAIEDKFAVIELDLVRVKGKTEPERIYGLFGDRALAENLQFRALKKAVEAMLTAYRAGEWGLVLRRVGDVEKLVSALQLEMWGYCALFRNRLNQLQETPPDENWTGVYDAQEK